MQYVGGKQKSGGQHIAAAIRALNPSEVVEPFCGGLSVTYRLNGLPRQARDACAPLITLYRAIQRGWDPPVVVTKKTWERYRQAPDPEDPMTAFCGFGCSRSGAWFSSFILDYKYTRRRVYAADAARRSLLKKLSRCIGVTFSAGDYRSAPLQGVVYCDPPYADTVGYPAVGTFDHEAFWDWARQSSREAPLLVSELRAPEDFIPVLSWKVQSRLATGSGGTRRERLFVHESRHDTVAALADLQLSKPT